MVKQRIIIIGAGISGLALGWFLKERASELFDISILEKEDRIGGYIQTVQKGRFCFETGPHSFRIPTGDNSLLRLVSSLNLESELISAQEIATSRYLWVNHKLQQLPQTLWGAAASSLTRPLAWHLIRDLWQPRKGTAEDETVHDFISRRFSSEVAEQLIDPIATGIYAGDIRKLSSQSCFPTLCALEDRYRSLILGGLLARESSSNRLFSFKRGMHSLPAALAQQLAAQIHLSSPVETIRPHSTGVEVVLRQGNSLHADHLFISTPLYCAAPLIQPHHSKLAERMRGVPYASIAAVNFGFRRNLLRQEGFGYLIPRQEKEMILGMIWSSSIFPEQNGHPQETRLTVLLGGMHSPRLVHESEKSLQKIAENALKRHLNIYIPADSTHISIAHSAVPQYIIGHHGQVQYMQEELRRVSPVLHYIGTGFSGVSIVDCIQTAERTAKELENGTL